MNVYVITRCRWGEHGYVVAETPMSAWATRRAAVSECDRLNKRVGWGSRNLGTRPSPTLSYHVTRVALAAAEDTPDA